MILGCVLLTCLSKETGEYRECIEIAETRELCELLQKIRIIATISFIILFIISQILIIYFQFIWNLFITTLNYTFNASITTKIII